MLLSRFVPGAKFFPFSVRRETYDDPEHQEFQGVIVLSVNPRIFTDFYERLVLSGVSTVSLRRADGSVLARYPVRPDEPQRAPENSRVRQAIAAHPQGGFIPEGASASDGVVRMTGYRPVPGFSLYVVASLDRSAVLAEWRSAMASYLIFGVPATAGLTVLALLALRQSKRESEALVQLRAETALSERQAAELRVAAAELRVAKDAAERANAAKDDFLATMSHEIRTPMTGVLGMADLLAAEPLSTDQRRFVEAIRSSGRHLLGIINDVLDFSRIETSKFELEHIDFSIPEVR